MCGEYSRSGYGVIFEAGHYYKDVEDGALSNSGGASRERQVSISGKYPFISVSICITVSNDNIKESLIKFLSASAECYTRLLSSMESQLSFKTSELVYDQVQFSSKTQRRKVGQVCWCWNRPIGSGMVSPWIPVWCG